MRCVSLIAIAMVALSCAPRAERNDIAATDYIQLERTPCFGSCPVYSLRIKGDGETEFTGTANVKVMGTLHSHVSLDSVRLLFDRAEQMHFFELNDGYESVKINDSVIEMVTDLPGRRITLSHAGRTKSVYDYYGGPPELRQLAEEIDRVANASQWVGR